ncbi:hypothetical protein E2542_SST06846 [Spatholobus suberectus]|nr:hypothetical protein E2542_SST06846 [Spatholobus suberectus]
MRQASSRQHHNTFRSVSIVKGLPASPCVAVAPPSPLPLAAVAAVVWVRSNHFREGFHHHLVTNHRRIIIGSVNHQQPSGDGGSDNGSNGNNGDDSNGGDSGNGSDSGDSGDGCGSVNDNDGNGYNNDCGGDDDSGSSNGNDGWW